MSKFGVDKIALYRVVFGQANPPIDVRHDRNPILIHHNRRAAHSDPKSTSRARWFERG
jgi:hypothetical protein